MWSNMCRQEHINVTNNMWYIFSSFFLRWQLRASPVRRCQFRDGHPAVVPDLQDGGAAVAGGRQPGLLHRGAEGRHGARAPGPRLRGGSARVAPWYQVRRLALASHASGQKLRWGTVFQPSYGFFFNKLFFLPTLIFLIMSPLGILATVGSLICNWYVQYRFPENPLWCGTYIPLDDKPSGQWLCWHASL